MHLTPSPARAQEVAHHELVRALRLDAAKEGSKARQEFELAARELGAKYARRMQLLREDLELRRKHELHEARLGEATGWTGQCRSRAAFAVRTRPLKHHLQPSFPLTGGGAQEWAHQRAHEAARGGVC